MAERVIIVGAGLAGCLLAVQLGQAGYEVLVLERRRDPRGEGAMGGRSINLAISVRGLDALNRAGLKERMLQQAVRMPGRMIHTAGSALFQPYSRDSNRAINSMSRSGLNLALIEAADALENVSLVFDSPLVGIEVEATVAITTAPDGSAQRYEGDLIVGADGAYSAVRQQLQQNPRFNFTQDYLDHGYKELHIPPVTEGPHAPFAIEPNALHIWPHGGSMMIALPNLDGSFTCTLFWPYEGDHGFDRLEGASNKEVVEFFTDHYSDAVPFMPTLAEDYAQNPTSPLVTIRCKPWSNGRVVLLGDAAHAVVPFYGQGANAAFEDCNEFVDALANHPHDLERAIREFESARIDNANAIADLALQNFIEMRDHTGNKIRRVQKKGSQLLGGVVPALWTPLYDMVSFTTTPYAEARTKARRQAVVLTSAAVVFLVLLAIIALIWSQYS